MFLTGRNGVCVALARTIFYLVNSRSLHSQMIVIPMLTVWVASRLLPHIAFLVLVPLVLLVTISAFTRRVYAQEGRSEAIGYAAGALLFVGVGYVISLCL